MTNTQIFTNILKNTKGKFFGVTFVKQNGETQNLNGNLKQDQDPDSPYLVVYDAQKKGFRSVNKSTILSVRFDGVELRVR